MGPIYPIYNPDSGNLVNPNRQVSGSKNPKTSFSDILSQELKSEETISLEFSKHAIKRSRQRGIDFTLHDIKKISEALEKMQKKGSREALLLYKDVGLLVNVRDRKVITCVDRKRLKEDVFTNIDGVMILE